MEGIEGSARLAQWIQKSDDIVFFGGAGVSTESGIPDFRSVDGLYNQKYKYPPETIISHSLYIRRADMLIIGGTSLTVYPAAGLIDYYNGTKLVLINRSVTPMDGRADLVISGSIGEVLGDIVEAM